MAAFKVAESVAKKFIGEPEEHPYENYIRYVEPVTQEPVYHARGTSEYDLVIPSGVLSAVVRNMPWILQHLVFVGSTADGSTAMEFSQKGPWKETKTEFFGECIIFEDVWPKALDNFEACERIEKYRPVMEQIVKDAIQHAKEKETHKKDHTS